MKKLLQINVTANIGSTGRIVENLGKLSNQIGWDSFIACKEDYLSESSIIKVGSKKDFYLHVLSTRLFDNHGFSSIRATKDLIEEIEKIAPDVVHLHNIHGYYINIEVLFNYLKKIKKPIFWTLYDCWAFTGHCAYFDLVNCDKWKNECVSCPNKTEYPKSVFLDNSKNNFNKKKNLFSGVEDLTLIVNSNWLKENVKQSFLSEYKVEMIYNGINLSDFFPKKDNKKRVSLNLKDKFVVLGVANVWNRRKGLLDFIKLSKELQEDEVIVLDGLTEKQKKNLPNNIIALKRAKSIDELVSLYSMANVFFNPTWEDNFPTTNLEALACGIPVITYDSGGSPEAISSSTGFVVEKGDINRVVSSIEEIKKKGKESYFDSCINRATEEFNYLNNYKKIVNLYNKN